MSLDWYVIWDYRADLLSGLRLTVAISATAIVGATVVGILVGCLGTMPGFLCQRLTGVYVEVIRNIPLVVKLFFAHFILGIDALPAGLIVLIIHQGAYIADVTAAGLRSVSTNQTEAALASGLSYRQTFCSVLLPQALRAMIPPLTTQYTQIVKNSAVVMLIALQDLTFMAQRIESETFRSIEANTTVTILYLLLVLTIALTMSGLQRLLNRRWP
jgi:His/Glu/Gln/Arg/opine family amino acid ABC transporter permease subunit